MPVRPLQEFEKSLLPKMWDYYDKTNGECAHYLCTPNGPLVESVNGSENGADPKQATIDRALAGESFLVHHNHPSQSSISGTDLNGVVKLGFSEIFAYAGDGTVYWVRCLNHQKLGRLAEHENLAYLGNCALSAVLNSHRMFNELDCIERLDAHVMNLALARLGVIEYEVDWGTSSCAPTFGHGRREAVNIMAARLQRYCSNAAIEMEKKLQIA